MSRNRSVPPLQPKRCAFCDGILSERRPPFVVALPNGMIYGRYHAGCAEKLVLAHKGKKIQLPLPGEIVGVDHLEAREERLPW